MSLTTSRGKATLAQLCEAINLAAKRPKPEEIFSSDRVNLQGKGQILDQRGPRGGNDTMVNASFPWNDWQAALRRDPDLAHAFSGGTRRIEVRPQHIIARFVTPGESGELRPWWIPMSTLERIAELSAQASGRLGATARVALAVRQDWNRTMRDILLYRLLAPYWAWLGRAAPQPYRTSDVPQWHLLGGEYQLYLPDLRAGHVVRAGTALSHFRVPRSAFHH